MIDDPAKQVAIIIPTFNHSLVVREAIASALAQTVPCHIIVVDDGSTDGGIEPACNTGMDLARNDLHGHVITTVVQKHAGVCAARNVGLECVREGTEFVMFLDADDTIAPTKVEEQLAAFTPEVGWVICDVMIQDAARCTNVLASERYAYADKDIGGWIQPMLRAANFIPIMAPLVRREVLRGIKFDEARQPEDWHFWHDVAARARVRYLPRVLATYRKSKTGRSRMPMKVRRSGLVMPLRLNLGCGTPGTRSWHPIEGMANLDKSMGWTFEDGLGEFVDNSVAGITVSHSLMYVPFEKWRYVFGEFARVLEPGGVIRITEDDSINPASRRHGGWRGSESAVVTMDANVVRSYVAAAGLQAMEVAAGETNYRDKSLCQQQHGSVPDVFFVEGIKVSKVLFAPHNDDETLFAAFTILKHRPRVVVCFGSSGDYGDSAVRAQETREAMDVLGGDPVEQWDGGGPLVQQMCELERRVRPTVVFAPSRDCSHPDHRAVADAALSVFGTRVVAYHTYNGFGKVRDGVPQQPEPEWIEAKLRALARYVSQIRHPRAHVFFMDDLNEYHE